MANPGGGDVRTDRRRNPGPRAASGPAVSRAFRALQESPCLALFRC